MKENDLWKSVEDQFTKDMAKQAYYLACESMATLNMNGAALMQKYKCHGATDITGFGIKGHAENLIEVQKNEIDYVIEKLPIIEHMDVLGSKFKLLEGLSAETSGGLFVMVPKEVLNDFQ